MAGSVSSGQSPGSVTYVSNTGSQKTKGLTVDTDTFLQLLVAQLQYQDPLEPQTDTAFVTQLAQMTSLEQMQQMNTSLTSGQAYDMIGKYVYAEVLNEKTGVTACYLGLADSVILQDGEPFVVIGDNAIAASDVSRVFDASYFDNGTEADPEPSAQTDSVTG